MNVTRKCDIDQQFSEIMKCFVCHRKSENPKVIPCCGAIGCEKCIMEILTAKNQKCPNCNQVNINGSVPIHLHFLEKMNETITCLNVSLNNENFCKKHSKQVSFFCKTCNQVLCSDCIFEEMISENKNHDNHDLKKIEDITIVMKKELQKELEKLSKIMQLIHDESNVLISEEENLNLQKMRILVDLNNKFKEIMNKLELKIKEDKEPIEKQLENLEKFNEKILFYISQCEKTMLSDDPQILINSSKIKKEIDAFIKSAQIIDFKTPPIDIQNELIPPFQMVRIEIPKFKKEQQKYAKIGRNKTNCNYFYSDKKLIYGNKWRVKIYPNGNLSGEGTHLSVFIELVRGCQKSKTYFYRIEIESQVPTAQNISKQFSSIFENGDTWGWNKAVPLETIFQNGYLNKEGTLSILFGIRPESYYQLYMDIKSSITHMKDKFKNIRTNTIINQ